MKIDRELREALDFNVGGAGDRDKRGVAHRSRIASLKQKFNHTIEYICHPEEHCFAWALGLPLSLILEIYKASNYEHFLSGDFVSWAIKEGHLTALTTDEASEGALVVYSDGDIPKHAGIVVAADRVRSTWGDNPLYEHGNFEVPSSYGDKIALFQRPSRDLAERLYRDFAARI